ncbi:MAG: pyrroloquinoline quinone biosynthesis protein PqqB [Hydrocarboniphaga sp.]|uniref:pyrroloquinoline quinone biosynthesis protein PqqB n=1 Tax=Hydrocarboniphaga sp. TaxID=2033016 RepID=UPI002627E6C1|nr:pyrroloquinoline quinone biosynthesis protein PqqB [Hydrocarboniphaga sp.]MDB5972071.1 pyrroloquinoline quinone biosynthesis protein PqqB [Hydrocarboniphaga sp.]
MRVHVLGSAAGGGFPQWNCNCRNCDGLRRGTLKARRRTQSSIALSDDGARWLLCNASPDILQQLQDFPALQPARALRDTAIAALLLIDAQIDHSTGLYMLREHRQPLALWCTTPVFEDLTRGNPILDLLKHYCGIDRHEIPLDARPFDIAPMPGLQFTAIPLRSNAPPYSPHRDRPVPGDNIGLLVQSRDSGRRLFYAPGLGEIEPPVWEAMRSADVVLIDGTCWRDDELVALGASKKTARDMGHLPQTGAGGMVEWLAELPSRTRRILIHINNTNPILDEDSAEFAQLRAAGVEVAWDGMDIEL